MWIKLSIIITIIIINHHYNHHDNFHRHHHYHHHCNHIWRNPAGLQITMQIYLKAAAWSFNIVNHSCRNKHHHDRCGQRSWRCRWWQKFDHDQYHHHDHRDHHEPGYGPKIMMQIDLKADAWSFNIVNHNCRNKTHHDRGGYDDDHQHHDDDDYHQNHQDYPDHHEPGYGHQITMQIDLEASDR